ncbi:MAG: glycosyltransferase family 2 protein [Anaerolineaceae bacterium]|nr:glycosyltransferase family 2 protein [Anaerolineaceae bacterium]
MIDTITLSMATLKNPFLSIIIPAYNEAARLPGTLEQVNAFLASQPFTSEIIVVENGSTDGTFEIALGLQKRIANLKVMHEHTPGKGWAVRQGMLAAKGEYRFICDADLSMPIEEVTGFLPPILQDAPIAIASREMPGAVRYAEPEYRHLIGRAFNTLVRLLLLPGLQDTQCGFKCFRADAAEKIFPLLTIRGWTFDVEALFIARKLGFGITEVPIPWYFKPQSRVKVLRDSLQMGVDLLKIRWNALKGKYLGAG